MGIKYLHSLIYNMFIIQGLFPLISINELKGLTLAIDILPFIYNILKSSNKDINDIFAKYKTFLETFKHAGVNLIVVFDKNGYSTASEFKQFTILQRKKKSSLHYNSNKLMSESETDSDTETFSNNTDTTINHSSHSNIVLDNSLRIKFKELTKQLNFTWSESNNEAEAKCVKLFNSLKVNGCISTDSDLLLYGCTYIFKDFNPITKEIRCINMADILKHLKMSQTVFTTICIIYGTDYIAHNNDYDESTICTIYPTSLISNLNERIKEDSSIKTKLLSMLFDSYEKFRENNISIVNTLNDELIINSFVKWLNETLNFKVNIDEVNNIRKILFDIVNDNDDSVINEHLDDDPKYEEKLKMTLIKDYNIINLDIILPNSPRKNNHLNSKNTYKKIITT